MHTGNFVFIILRYRTKSCLHAKNHRTAGKTEYVANMGYDSQLLSVQKDVVMKD
jgi:hypothetical protein